jgi:hypothetical protein
MQGIGQLKLPFPLTIRFLLNIINKGVTMKKLIGIITIVILGFTVYLILRIPNPRASTQTKQETVTTSSSSEEWLGIFLEGKRVGYSFTKILRSDQGLTVENRTQWTLIMLNEKRSLTSHLFAHTDEDYFLKDFAMEIKAPGHPARIEGKIEGKELKLTSYSHGIPQTQIRTLKEKPYFPDAIEEVIKKRKLKTGDKISLPYFDPTTQSSATATLEIFDREKVAVFDKEYIGLRVEINFMGIKAVLWLDDNYELIKESAAMGLEMIPLSKEEALAEIEATEVFDLLSFFAVKLNKSTPDPRGLSYLKVELKDITTENLDMSDYYQKLTEGEPIMVESYLAKIAELPDFSIPISKHKEFLEPSVYIQCRDQEIVAKANELAGDERDAKKVVGRLVRGVYQLLKKSPLPSLPSAIDVLKTKEGDCNEHSVLFAALARAMGIPTKIYVGLVNLGGSGYYYHAWNAVWLGEWVPVDATLNQYPADVGHLKLKEGEISEWANVLKVVGKLNIDVLEYKLISDSQ